MLCVQKKYKGMRWHVVYFAHERMKEMEKQADIVEYNFFLTKEGRYLNQFRKPCEWNEFVTLITDLRRTEDELFIGIQKNGRYEIRRAEREGITFRHYDSSIKPGELEQVISFYNLFVDTKEELCFKLSYEYLKPYIEQEAFWCTVAMKDDEILVAHFYYGDGTRIRLWYSASLFRNEDDSGKKGEVGRANRFLHWKDMRYFKQAGFQIYDWGGYSERKDVAGISKFKKSFGGEIEKGMCILTFGSLTGKMALMYRRLKGQA